MDVQAKGVEETVTNLHALGQRASDLRRVSEKVRSVYRRSESSRFDTNASGTWEALADSTRERKAREGLDPRINRATFALIRSLTSTRASNQIDIREPAEFRFGTNLPYAPYVDARRKLIELRPNEQHEITDLIRSYITTKSDRAWFF